MKCVFLGNSKVLKITNSLENKTASNNNQLNAKREFKNELKQMQ